MKRKTVVLLLMIMLLLFALYACAPKDTNDDFSYTLTFQTNGGTQIEAVVYDGSADIVLPQPQKTGYTFEKWYLEDSFDTVFDKTSISKDTTVYAKWTLNSYTISFVTNSSTQIEPLEIDYNQTIPQLQSPQKSGFEFLGWFVDEDFSQEFNYTNMPAHDITLYADYDLIEYTISYVLNDGIDNGSNPIKYNVNSQEIVLSAPAKEHFEFLGWYAEESFNTQLTKITTGSWGNLTLYAKWDYQTVVKDGFTLRNNGLGELEVVAYDASETQVVVPSDYNGMPVTKIGPTAFANSLIESVSVPASVVTIGYRAFAECELLQEVTFAEQGNLYQIDQEAFKRCSALTSVLLPRSLVLMGTEIFAQCTSLQAVYVGRPVNWLTDYLGTHGAPGMFDGCNLEILNIYVYRSNAGVPWWREDWQELVTQHGAKDGVIVYQENDYWSDYSLLIKANPNEEVYDITYQLDSGTNGDNPSKYTKYVGEIVLSAPTKENYNFLGWYAEATFDTPVTIIESGSSGNLTLYASWEHAGK